MRRTAALARALPAARAGGGRVTAGRSASVGRAVPLGRPRTRLGVSLDAWLGRPPRGSGITGVQREHHQPEYLIVVAVVALTAVGILMVYSSSALQAYAVDRNTFAVVGPQIVWAVLGVIGMAITMQIDYRYWRLLSIPMYLGSIVLLLLVLVPGIGISFGDSSRWLQIGRLPAIHPAEFAKLALVVYLAHWLARRGRAVSGILGGTLPFLLIIAPIVLLVLREPDLGTTSVIAASALMMFFIAGASLWQFALLIPATLGAGALVILTHPYQLARVRAFLDPFSDPQGSGFHTVQGLLALALGGLFGSGLGASRQAASLYLPNASNDFIFAIIGEEFGLVGGLIVIALFALLVYEGIRVALTAPDTFGGLLAAGITAGLGFQAFVNIAVVVALLPVTGITLPFISAGGSSLIISFAAVGILLSISRETLPRGAWNDEDPDRGRGDRRTRVPGSGRRPQPARSTRRP